MAIVAVFLPVALMPGISGQFFQSFGYTVVISVLMSLFVARSKTNRAKPEHGHYPIAPSFLIGMGIFYIFFKKVNLNAAEAKIIQRFSKTDFTKIALSGFFINTLNPSVLLFWLINATAFAATNTLGERLMIFAICLLVNIIADVLKVMMAGKIRDSLTPRHILLINRISGSILVIFGLVLIYGTFYLGDK